MLGDSFEYTKEALMGKWIKWILLIIPFMAPGYTLQIYKGTKPAPEITVGLLLLLTVLNYSL